MAETLVPPGPRPLIGFPLLIKFRGAPISFMAGLRATYGDVVYFKAAGRRIYLFNDPESIQQMVVLQNK